MTKTIASGAATLVLVTALVLGGCGGGEQYGAAPSDRAPTPIADIVTDPAGFDGRDVTVSGTIERECPTGCWFDLREGTTIIHVDLAPNGLAIPQHVGRTVTVDGMVTLRDGRAIVHGKGVTIR